MTDRHDEYRSPLGTRYATEAMRRLFSERRRIRAWRELWIHLAEAERELGLNVTEAQVAALRAAGVVFRNDVESGPGGRQIQIEDPDGNPIELHERPR